METGGFQVAAIKGKEDGYTAGLRGEASMGLFSQENEYTRVLSRSMRGMVRERLKYCRYMRMI